MFLWEISMLGQIYYLQALLQSGVFLEIMFFILVISESEKESSDLAASISKVVIIIPLSSSDTESMLFLFCFKSFE